jgi:hypothetical protein
MVPALGRSVRRWLRSRFAVLAVGLMLLAPSIALAAPVSKSQPMLGAAASVRAPVSQATPAVFVGGGSTVQPASPIAIAFHSVDDPALRAAKLRAAAAASVGGRTPEAAVVTPALAAVSANKGGLDLNSGSGQPLQHLG